MPTHDEQIRETIRRALNAGTEVLITERGSGTEVFSGRIDNSAARGATWDNSKRVWKLRVLEGLQVKELEFGPDEVNIREMA